MPESAVLAPGIELPVEPILDTTQVGEGYKLKSSTTVEFTPDFAEKFLSLSEFVVGDEKLDRNLDNQHAIRLAREMLGGRFLWEQVNLVTCVCDGITYRLNGQHCSWARLAAHDEGLDPKTRSPVRRLHYEAETVADMRRLYASLDRGKSRNNNNQVVAWLAGTEEFEGYSKQTLQLLAHGIGTWQWESKHTRKLHGGDERSLLLLTKHHKVAMQVGTIIKGAKPSDAKHVRRAPVIGAMFATFAKAPHMASEFWVTVRDGLGIGSKSDPRHTLRNLLLSSGLQKSVVANGDNKILLSEEMYRACIIAWNAWRQGRDLKQIRVNMADPRPEPRG